MKNKIGIEDPQVISLDIETYGAAKTNKSGRDLPPQTVFHPTKSLYIDGVRPEDLILTVAITLPQRDPRCKKKKLKGWKPSLLGGLHPGTTMVLEMWNEMHRECLANWLRHADTILGMNLQFDLLYLRNFDSRFKSLLGEGLEARQTLIDLSVLNYLHSELREERSLKALGPILGAFSYKETLKNQRFPSAIDKSLLSYNGQDTHNTMLAISEFGRRLDKDFSDTDKASEWCLNFYSETIWNAIFMSESGIPMSSLRLEELFEEMKDKTEFAATQAKKEGLILQGEGSATSKDELLDKSITLISETTNPEILNELEVTEKRKKVSFTKGNRYTLLQHLPEYERDSYDYRLCLEYANKHSEAQKLLSSYCYPLLYHRRNKIEDRSSIIIPPNGTPLPFLEREKAPLFSRIADKINACDKPSGPLAHKNRFNDRHRNSATGDSFAYPTWYITPSHIKETHGSSGGTIQGRITCKNPSAQTFPPLVKSCIRSRFEEGVILGMDLSQIELRVASLLSGERSMIRAYKDGLDLHADRARSLWPDYNRLTSKQKDRRQVGKMMNFADLFLSSANTMQEQVYAQSDGEIDLPIEFFKEVVLKRHDTRPQLTDWQLSLLHTAKTTSRIVLPFTGQSRTFIGNIGKSRSEIVNFPVQTTAGNLALCIQHKIGEYLRAIWHDLKRKPYIFMQIYDAIYIDTPKSQTLTIKSLIRDAINAVSKPEGYWGKLEDYTGNSVPLEYDIEEINTED